jgi:hypothetical protein
MAERNRAEKLLGAVRLLHKSNGCCDLYASTDTNGPRMNRSLGRNPGTNDGGVGYRIYFCERLVA